MDQNTDFFPGALRAPEGRREEKEEGGGEGEERAGPGGRAAAQEKKEQGFKAETRRARPRGRASARVCLAGEAARNGECLKSADFKQEKI